MSTGIAVSQANAILDALCATVWIQLHIGDPGAAGTSNPAGNTVRKQATFGTPAAAGSIANTVAIIWTGVPSTEDYQYYSAWDAVSGGTFKFSGHITADAIGAGGTFTVGIGGLVVPFTTLAA